MPDKSQTIYLENICVAVTKLKPSPKSIVLITSEHPPGSGFWEDFRRQMRERLGYAPAVFLWGPPGFKMEELDEEQMRQCGSMTAALKAATYRIIPVSPR